MIQLDEITLHNYGYIRNETYTFGAGVTGIVGKNGSGKSTIISAIRFLFTGEVDAENKHKAITTGETEGWVTGKFTLNGTQGSIERHLSSSKVILKYGDTDSSKAGEIKELWAKLLQIDGSIFNNVIIAAQGEIPLLFSGDATIREKIFQKIFMVPPTEKLRDVIWNGYIKLCPPEKFEEDTNVLHTLMNETAHRRNGVLAQIDGLTALMPNQVHLRSFVERLGFLDKCKRDALVRPELETKLNEQSLLVVNLKKKAEDQRAKLDAVDIASLRKSLTQQSSKKELFERKQTLEAQLVGAMAKSPSDAEVKTLADEIADHQAQAEAFYNGLANANANLASAKAKYDKLAKIEGSVCCPTCGQELKDVLALLDPAREEFIAAQRQVAGLQTSYNEQYRLAKAKQGNKSLMDGLVRRKEMLLEQLSSFAGVTFDTKNLQVLENHIAQYEQDQVHYNELSVLIPKTEGLLLTLTERLANLTVYDGDDTIESEMQVLNDVLAEARQRQEQINELKLEEGKMRRELELLDSRMTNTVSNQEYNTKRRQYLDSLNEAYELLHVSRFPRNLIKSYAEHVQAMTSSYLEQFAVPYRVKIVDGFKFHMITDDDRVVPRVSGGQQVVVGLCLRLALHKMFAQSFPIWIVDEGSTHLDEENREAYFRLLNTIREQKIINQIIVIDHDPMLAEVVDRTIRTTRTD